MSSIRCVLRTENRISVMALSSFFADGLRHGSECLITIHYTCAFKPYKIYTCFQAIHLRLLDFSIENVLGVSEPVLTYIVWHTLHKPGWWYSRPQTHLRCTFGEPIRLKVCNNNYISSRGSLGIRDGWHRQLFYDTWADLPAFTVYTPCVWHARQVHV